MSARGPLWPNDAITRVGRAILRAAAWLVPGGRRDEWLGEWEGEFWQLRGRRAGAFRTTLFVAGAIWHAMFEWKEEWTMESMGQDIRYACRTLSRSPGFALSAIVMLTASIGASTALFTVLEAAVLADPPFPEPERLVVVDQMFGTEAGDQWNAAEWGYPRYADLREDVGSVDEAAGYSLRTMTLTELGDPTLVSVETVTPSLMPLLGIQAVAGRTFGAKEEDRGAPSLSAMVSNGFWQTRMGADPRAVGSIITLDGARLEVLGVLPAGFRGITGRAEVWIPMSALRVIEDPSFLEDPWNLHFNVVARLAPDATLASLQPELDAFASALQRRYPPAVAASRLSFDVEAVSFRDARSNPQAERSILALFGAVLLVLLVATANLAGLMLARGTNRQREAALRSSLGAARGRLLRQFMTESLVLSIVGGAAGVVVARLGIDLMGAWLTGALGTTGGRGIEYLDPAALTIDWSVLAFATALTVLVGLAFGLLPAWQASSADPNESLRGGHASEGGRRWSLGLVGRNGLIVVQVAVAIVLLTGATVMMRSMSNLQRLDLGYDREDLVTALYNLPPSERAAGADLATFHVDFLDRVRALPGVQSATLGEVPQAGPTWTGIVLSSEGRPELTPAEHTWIRLQPVADGHLDVLGLKLLEGRDIEPTDDQTSDPVIVLNEIAAAELFPDGNAIDQRIEVSWRELSGEGARVVGIFRTAQLGPLGGPPERQGLVSVRQAPRFESGLMVRTTRPVDDVERDIRAAMAELSGSTVLNSVMSMEERVASVTARPRVVTGLLGFFGGLTLFLVAAGLYGTIAFVVARRTPELGLRLSLGAEPRSILALVMKQSLGVTLVGIALGGAIAPWATHFLAELSFDAEGFTWTSLAPVFLILLLVAVAASVIPASRALRIDPVASLRSD